MRRVGAIVGCFAGGGELVHLIEAGEVVQRLGRGFADRLDRAGQIGQGFADGNQAVSLTLHSFIIPCPSGKEPQEKSSGWVRGEGVLPPFPRIQYLGEEI